MLLGSESPPQAAGLQSRLPGNAPERQHHLAQRGYLASVYPSVGPPAHPSSQQTSTTHMRAEQSLCPGEHLLWGLAVPWNLSAGLCLEGTLGTRGPSLRPCSAHAPVHGRAELSPACSGLSDARHLATGGPLPTPPDPPTSSVSSARASPVATVVQQSVWAADSPLNPLRLRIMRAPPPGSRGSPEWQPRPECRPVVLGDAVKRRATGVGRAPLPRETRRFRSRVHLPCLQDRDAGLRLLGCSKASSPRWRGEHPHRQLTRRCHTRTL